MKKMFSLVLLAAFCAFSPLTAQAEKIDFGALTCKDFTEMDENGMAMLYFWLDGYIAHKSGDTVLDTDAVENDLKTILEQCQKNLDGKILDLFNK